VTQIAPALIRSSPERSVIRAFAQAVRAFEGRTRLLYTSAAPARFVLDLPWLWLGRDAPGSSLCHHNAARVELALARPEAWMIDADVQPETQSLVITTTEPLRFLGF
jgi:hypothetical protein